MQLNKSSAEKRLQDMFMDDMPIIEFTPAKANISTNWFSEYKKVRADFLRNLTDSVQELAFMNLSQEEFMDLITAKKIPNNISIRMRIPLIYGGKIEPDNMFLCKTMPHAYSIDRFIIEQSDAKTLWLPNPEKKVYVPANTTGGGDGGNATEDRLSQMSAHFAADRGMG